MNISLNWLQDFIELTETDPQKIKAIITERSAEVETMEAQGASLDKIVVGEIRNLREHPDADALSLTDVFDGQETVQVVCGGSNLRMGMQVIFAPLGAVVRWHGEEVMEMKKIKIRGQESYGMICAAEEVGLGDLFPKTTEKEIVDLTPLHLNVGDPLAQALKLNDVVLEIDNHAITHRSDLFSQKGFAREFVANGLAKWKTSAHELPQVPTDSSLPPVQVKVESPELCSRYRAVYMSGVEVKESPDWLKKRLVACGINPISNLVDITNYVMLEWGMPLHAFDVDRIAGQQWSLKKSQAGETITTLDGQVQTLPEGLMVLHDGQENFDLCGVMGGLNSGVQPQTQNIWLHAPVYHPGLVRKAMRGLGHVSDAGILYEKGVDPFLAQPALDRAIELILELCHGATVKSQVLDLFPHPPQERLIPLRFDYLNKLLGQEIEASVVENILKDLGFGVKSIAQGFEITVPYFRLNDVQREADLVEEVARIYGYNHLPSQPPERMVEPSVLAPHRRRERELKNQLIALGFDEIYTFAFLGLKLLEKTGLAPDDSMIEVLNPISSDLSLMRTSLLPRLLETLAQNQRYQESFRLFELSRIYLRESQEAHQEKSQLMMATFGEDFRQLQGVLEHMDYGVLPAQNPPESFMHPGRMAELKVRGKRVGHLYQLHPRVAKAFDLKKEVVIAQIDVHLLHELNLRVKPKYQEIFRFPAVQLDVSLLVPQKSLSADYQSAIEKTDKTLIRSVRLIDEYSGEHVSQDQRALTYSITYQAKDRTLTEQEVDKIHQEVLKKLEAKGAQLRI